jgi:hypothetical protein
MGEGTSLFEAFASVPDVRSRRGQSYPLASVLGLLALGILLGRRSLNGIARLDRDYRGGFARLLGFKHDRTPTASNLGRILKRLDVAAFERALGAWVDRLTRALPPDTTAPTPPGPLPIHLDGKILRGSRDPAAELPGAHLLAAFAPRVQGVLAQIRVDATTNEHKAALELLRLLPARPGGHLISGDAIFCQKDVCQAIVDRSDHYLLAAKDNQPGLVVAIDAALGYAAVARTFSPGRPHRPGPPAAPPVRPRDREDARPGRPGSSTGRWRPRRC